MNKIKNKKNNQKNCIFFRLIIGSSLAISLPIVLIKKPVSNTSVKKSLKEFVVLNKKSFNLDIKQKYNRDLNLLNLNNIDSNENWDNDLAYYNFAGVINLNKKNTPFKGDISDKNLNFVKLKNVDVSLVYQVAPKFSWNWLNRSQFWFRR